MPCLLLLLLVASGAAASCSAADAGASGGNGSGVEGDPGIGGATGTGGADPFAAAPICTSGMTWDTNESEGPDMGPGRACVACHADANAASGEADAPLFAFAGTIYPSAHEPDYCISQAVAGAVVEITDARGMTFTAPANGSGNFFSEDGGVTPPYMARVLFDGRSRQMLVPQVKADCNGCHTQNGDFAAPGRILLP